MTLQQVRIRIFSVLNPPILGKRQQHFPFVEELPFDKQVLYRNNGLFSHLVVGFLGHL